MIDINREKLVALRNVPDLPFIPSRRQGKKLNKSTLFRWATTGFRGRRLECIRIGAERYTSVEALQRFFSTGCEDVVRHPESDRTQASARSMAAEKELDKLGI